MHKHVHVASAMVGLLAIELASDTYLDVTNLIGASMSFVPLSTKSPLLSASSHLNSAVLIMTLDTHAPPYVSFSHLSRSKVIMRLSWAMAIAIEVRCFPEFKQFTLSNLSQCAVCSRQLLSHLLGCSQSSPS